MAKRAPALPPIIIDPDEPVIEDLLHGYALIELNRPKYDAAEAQYDGTADEVMSSRRIRALLQEQGKDMRVNFVNTPVDVIADRLVVLGAVGSDDAATNALELVWKRNRLDLEIPDFILNTCKLGNGYLIVWPGNNDDAGQTVDVHWNDPRCTVIVYSPENPRERLFAVKIWDAGGRKRAEVYRNGWVAKYRSTAAVESGTSQSFDKAGDWEEWTDDEDLGLWPLINPYDKLPVFELRTGLKREPLHLRGYGAQNAINKIVASHLASVDFQAIPQRFAIADGKVDADDTAALYDDETTLEKTRQEAATKRKSSLKSGPGELWWLEGVSEAGQFESADAQFFIDTNNFFIRAMAQVTSTPLHRFDPQGDAPAGESLRAQDKPTVDKAKRLLSLLDASLEDALDFALELLGMEAATVEIQWQALQTLDDAEGWATVQAKMDAGVPALIAFQEAGYPKDVAEAWMKANADDNVASRVDQLTKIGDAVQRLSIGVTAGVVDVAQVHALVAALISAATEGTDVDDELLQPVAPPPVAPPVPMPPPAPAPVTA